MDIVLTLPEYVTQNIDFI